MKSAEKFLLFSIFLCIGCGSPNPIPKSNVHPNTNRSTLDEDLFESELTSLRKYKDWIGVERKCLLALNENPNLKTIWVSLGEAYDKLGKSDDSIIAMNRALAIDQNYAAAWIGLAVAYNHSNLHEKALSCYDHLLKSDPDKARILWDLVGANSKHSLETNPIGSKFKVKYRPSTLLYPSEAKKVGIQGNVVIEMSIGVDGIISSLKVLSGPYELRNEALSYAKQWLFEPLVINGNPISGKFILTIPFKLK